MFDNLKLLSVKLNANFRINVFIPKDYDKNNDTYNTLYIVSPSNPYANQNYNLENILSDKNVIGVAIYPNLDISKNKLLFNSFVDKAGFAALYEDFIINEVKPLIAQKYRVNSTAKGNAILGFKDTAILAYSLAHHYSNQFEKVLMYDLYTDSFHKLFMADLMSKFDPNIAFYFSMTNNQKSIEIEEILRLFGSTSFKLVNRNITDLLELI